MIIYESVEPVKSTFLWVYVLLLFDDKVWNPMEVFFHH